MADDTRPIDLIAARVVYLERELARQHDLFSDAIAQLAQRQDRVEGLLVSVPLMPLDKWPATDVEADLRRDELRASLDDVTARRPTVQEQIERG